MVEFKCPVCGQMTSLLEESIYESAEILCRECSAILVVEQAEPLLIAESDLADS